MDGIRGANMAGQTDAMYQVISSTIFHIFWVDTLRLCIFKTQPHLGDEGWRNHFILGPHISYDEPSHIMVINLSSRVPVFLDQITLNLPISTILAYIQKRVVLV